MTCHSEVVIEQTSTGNDTGGSVGGTVKSLKWSNCVTDPSGIKCTATSGSGYTGSISGSTLTISSATKTEVTCEGGMVCTFKTEGLEKNDRADVGFGRKPATFATLTE